MIAPRRDSFRDSFSDTRSVSAKTVAGGQPNAVVKQESGLQKTAGPGTGNTRVDDQPKKSLIGRMIQKFTDMVRSLFGSRQDSYKPAPAALSTPNTSVRASLPSAPKPTTHEETSGIDITFSVKEEASAPVHRGSIVGSLAAMLGVPTTTQSELTQTIKHTLKDAMTASPTRNTDRANYDSKMESGLTTLNELKDAHPESAKEIDKAIHDLQTAQTNNLKTDLKTIETELKTAQKTYAKAPNDASKAAFETKMKSAMESIDTLQTSATACSMTEELGTLKSDLQTLQKRDAIVTSKFHDIATMDTNGLRTLLSDLSSPIKMEDLKSQGLTSGDIELLKTVCEKTLSLDTLVTTGAPSSEVKTAAKALMTLVQQHTDGDSIRAFSKSEATTLVQSKVLNSVMGEISKTSTKSEITSLKTKLNTFDDATGLAKELTRDFGVSAQQIGILRTVATDSFCKAFGDTQNITSLTIGEIRAEAKTLPAFFEKIGASPAQTSGVLENLDHMDHFATHFDSRQEGTRGAGNGDKFATLSTENKGKLLELYQNGGLIKDDPATGSFLNKLASTFEGDSNAMIDGFTNGVPKTESHRAEQQSQTQYQFLRFVADFGDVAGRGNSHFDDVIVRLGQTSERLASNGDTVKPGFTIAQHKLHNTLSAFSEKINEGISDPSKKLPSGGALGHLRFDVTTIKAIAANSGLSNVNIVLARVIDLQNKIENREDLTGPPSEETKATIQECGLNRGQSMDSFVQGLKIGGVSSSAEMAIFLETLGDVAKELSTNAALKGNITSVLQENPKALMDAYVQRLDTSRSDSNAQLTVAEQATSMVGSAKTGVTSAKVSLKNVWLSLRGKDHASVQKYLGKTATLYSKISITEQKVAAAGKDSEAVAEGRSSGSVLSRSIQLERTGFPGFPMGDGVSLEMKGNVKGDEHDPGYPLGEKVGGTVVTHEHLQLLQNKQFISSERAEITTSLMNTVGSFATEIDPAVVKAVNEKLSFLSGGNSNTKQNLIPGIVKREPGGMTAFFEIHRQPDGTVKETKVGNLTKVQAQHYTQQLETLGKKSKSDTVSAIALTVTPSPRSTAALNQYLGRIQLGDVNGEHLQLCQNRQLVGAEKTALTATLGSAPPTAFLTGADPKVTAALATKTAFIQGGNDTSKRDLIPGVVKEKDGQVTYFEIHRDAGGVIKETPVGVLTRDQAAEYLGTLATDTTRSKTADLIAAKYPTADFSAPELHSYLGLTQLASNVDSVATQKQALSAEKAKFQEVIVTGGMQEPLESIKKAIVQEISAQMDSGQSFEAVLARPQDLLMAVTTKMQVESSEAGALPDQATLRPLVRYALQEIRQEGVAGISEWVKGVDLSSAGEAKLEADTFSTSFSNTKSMMQEAIGRLESSTDGISIASGQSVTLDLSSVTKAFSPIDLSASATVRSENAIDLHRGQDGKLVIDLNATFGGGGTVGAGFLSTLSATLGVNVSSTDVLHCSFESDEKAAGFMAALQTGKPELAIFHVEDLTAGSGKSVSVNAQLSGQFELPVSAKFKSAVLPSFAVEVEGSVSKTTIAGVHGEAKEPVIETRTSLTRSYSHEATLGVAVGGLSGIVASDARSFKTDSNESVVVNPATNTLKKVTSEQLLQLDINGTTFTNSTDAINIGERRLGQIISLDSLRSAFPADAAKLQGLLTGFDPMTQKISVTEELKPKALLDINNNKFDTKLRDRILANPANFTMTVSVISTKSEGSEKAYSAGVASAEFSTSVSQSSSQSVTFGSSFSISRELSHAKSEEKSRMSEADDNAPIQILRSTSAKTAAELTSPGLNVARDTRKLSRPQTTDDAPDRVGFNPTQSRSTGSILQPPPPPSSTD